LIKRIAHIVLSLWLAIILIFGTTPKEFIHLFANHEDTVHVHEHTDGFSIEQQHHHCDFLDDALPLFINDFSKPVIPQGQHIVAAFYTAYDSQFEGTIIYSTTLRGPPVA
jgi:hypothetical protein